MEYKMSRRNLLGNYTQSTRVKDICILLVNDDYLCQTIVADMLDHCRYEVSHFPYEREMDAVNMIWERKDVTELVLTNVHRTYAKRHGIIEHIEKQIQLKVLLMPWGVDDINVSTLGGNGLTVYYMKCSVSEMDNLWANALAREKNKRESSSGKFLLQENAGSKRMLDDNDPLGNIEKKPRVNWTQEMHQKFLEAIAQLGDDKAFPKKIVELMNVPGLTRANVASHLQKYRMCMKRAQEGFTRSSSYDYANKFGYNTLQESFQQSRWNPFQMGSRNTTIPQYNFDYLKSRSRPHHGLSLLKTIRYKPSHNFSVYGDQTKNILLRSVEDNRMHPNTSFAGFRLARDGKSVVFGQNSQLASSVQQQFTFPEIRNDDSTLFSPLLSDFTQQSSVAPLGIGCEPVSMTNQLPSLAELLAVDEPVPVTITQPQSSAVPLEFEWNKVASQQPPSPLVPTWSGLDEQLKFTCEPQQELQQPGVMTPPEAAGPQWTEWHEPHEFSPQQPLSGNTGNAGSDILSDFASSVLPEYCELGAIGDEIGVDATGLSDFDASLFDN